MKLDKEELKGKSRLCGMGSGTRDRYQDCVIAALPVPPRRDLLAEEIMAEEVWLLAGEPYSRNKSRLCGRRYSRWGTNPGSVQLEREKVPIEVQRLYDHERGGTIGLETYRKLHKMESPEAAVVPINRDQRIEHVGLSVGGKSFSGEFWFKSFQCQFAFHRRER